MKKLLTAIQVLLLLIFFGCAGYVGKYFYDAHSAKEGFETLRAEVRADSGKTDASGGYELKRADNGMLAAYYDLYEQNNDLFGWIKIDGTVIDYPVMKADSNDFYLHRDFYKKYQYAGTPFADSETTGNSANRIIYAHNMKDGTMFAALLKYEDRDFYAEHKKILFDTLYEKGEYEVISVFRTKVGTKAEFRYYDYADITDEADFDEYIKRVTELSEYDAEYDAVYGDSLITLSTCAYHTSNERIVVVAAERK